MAQQLSPKQYIQTKARTLPVYKCFVNKDWQEAHEANVFIMRRHNNGNITAAMYLVDLLCLGIKDTFYFFNEPEGELMEQLGGEFIIIHSEVGYNLAHNIIYAAHDFAMEFDIKPHADFAVTKFLLEEDNDEIELIDIETGDNGVPHLMVNHAGQYSDALAKLKKNAGEGNYFYTIADEQDEDDEYEDESDDDDFEVVPGDYEAGGENYDYDENADDDGDLTMMLDEIEVGSLTVLDASFIADEDIFNEHEVSEREEDEKLTINVEAGIRALRTAKPELFEDDEELDEITAGFATGIALNTDITTAQKDEYSAIADELIAFYEKLVADGGGPAGIEKAWKVSLLEKHGHNPLIAKMIFEGSVADADTELNTLAKNCMLALAPSHVIVLLSLALAALIKQDDVDKYLAIYNSSDIVDALPERTGFDLESVNTYCLIQALVSIRDKDLAPAIYYYYLAADTEEHSNLLPPIQAELLQAIGTELGLDKGEDDIRPTLRIV